MAKQDTRTDKKYAKRKKKNLKKADRYERASKRKTSKAQSNSLTSLNKPKKRAKSVYQFQEASNFADEVRSTRASGGMTAPKKRRKLQVNKRSAAKDLPANSVYKKSSGGRKRK